MASKPQEIDNSRKYRMEIIRNDMKAESKTMSGNELVEKRLVLHIEKRKASLLVRYKTLGDE